MSVEIALESPGLPGQPFQKRQPRIRIMTIGAALICNNAIVVASDSQMSDWETGRTDRDENKIVRIDFAHGASALVARSGHADYSSQAVERLMNLAATETLDDYRKPAELADRAVSEIKRNIIRDFQMQDEARLRYFAEHNFALLVAFYFDRKPYVFVVRSEGAGVTLMRGPQQHVRSRNHVLIGCGEVLANFFLSSQDVAEMQLGEAIATAIYTVEEVKKADPRCAGPTKVAFTFPVVSQDLPEMKTQTVVMDREEIAQRVRKIATFDDEFKAEWKRRLTDMVYGVAQGLPVSLPPKVEIPKLDYLKFPDQGVGG